MLWSRQQQARRRGKEGSGTGKALHRPDQECRQVLRREEILRSPERLQGRTDLETEEAHPKERITLIEEQLDAAAKAKAEEERLLREKQERDKRYNDLITAADKAFAAKNYEKARTDYRAALEVKPEEQYPKDRLAEINSLLGMRPRKQKRTGCGLSERLQRVLQRPKQIGWLRKPQQRKRLGWQKKSAKRTWRPKQIDAEYKELVAAGDIAFGADDFDKARDKYTAALGVKPQKSIRRTGLAAIDASWLAKPPNFPRRNAWLQRRPGWMKNAA